MSSRFALLLSAMALVLVACSGGTSESIFEASQEPADIPTTTTVVNELEQVQVEPASDSGAAPGSAAAAVEAFFTAADAYFASPGDGEDLLEAIASEAAFAAVVVEHQANVDRPDFDQINELELLTSSVFNTDVSPAGATSLATACVERTGTNQAAGTITSWLTVELDLAPTASSWAVEQYRLVHDGGVFSGPGCVPDYAEERAAVAAERALGVIEATTQDPSLTTEEIAGAFGGAQLTGILAQIDEQRDLNARILNPGESRVEPGAASDPTQAGLVAVVGVCQHFPGGLQFVDIDDPSTEVLPAALAPGESRASTMTVLLGASPEEDRVIGTGGGGAGCW